MKDNRSRRKQRTGRAANAKIAIEDSALYPYLARYQAWQRVKGYSDATISRADSALRRFIHWCDERYIEDPISISKPIVERYQRSLFYHRRDNGSPLAFRTQHSLLAAVKAWFKWLTRENYLPSNPASEVQGIKVPVTLPEKVLSVEDVERIAHAIDVDELEGLRNRAIVEVLYSTGVRRSELCHLQLGDINYKRCTLFVRQGKGRKDRCIPIGASALVWVERYCSQSRPRLLTDVHEEALFLNPYGHPLSPSYLGHIIKGVLLKANIKEGNCHLFRHAMATHMLEKGAELRYIQAILGHASIDTTTVYTHLAIEQLQAVHAATHPSIKA